MRVFPEKILARRCMSNLTAQGKTKILSTRRQLRECALCVWISDLSGTSLASIWRPTSRMIEI